ncbi:putative quinol monooxygenase [Aureimonas populi]|uniref:Quinol monooxygenase n=1 Tax=Aureimonas populi TaxID=1701758 RepID=A0ABW5CS51_9HYPH|nr:putative quinol monooxygenase [Aureimonas populi]
MIVVSGTLRLAPEDLAALRDMAGETIAATRAEPGCIVYAFAEDFVEPGLVRIYEEWESRAALDAHGRTAHIAAWRQALAGVTIVSSELKLTEVGAFEPFA